MFLRGQRVGANHRKIRAWCHMVHKLFARIGLPECRPIRLAVAGHAWLMRRGHDWEAIAAQLRDAAFAQWCAEQQGLQGKLDATNCKIRPRTQPENQHTHELANVAPELPAHSCWPDTDNILNNY